MTTPLPLPSQADLQTWFIYDPETGGLWWRKFVGGNTRGRKCGIDQVKIFANRYATARVIWKRQTGDEPPMVDHWDGNQRNHKWDNLRGACAATNGANSERTLPVATGQRGVRPNGYGKFTAQIKTGGRLLHLGTFDTVEAAVAARVAAEEKYQGAYAVRNRAMAENK